MVARAAGKTGRPKRASSGAAGLTRKGERTREKLLEAADDIVRHQGMASLSVTEITRRVGCHSSLFYSHFTNLDALLGALAEHSLAALTPVMRALHAEVLRSALADRPLLGREFRKVLDQWLEQRPVVEMLLAHRLDPPPLGEALRAFLLQYRADLTTELWTIAQRLGVPPDALGSINLLGDQMCNLFLWALEAALSGRYADRQEVAEVLADALLAGAMATFRRSIEPSRAELLQRDLGTARLAELDAMRKGMAEAVGTRTDAELVAQFGGLETLVDAVLNSYARYFLASAVRYDAVVVFRITHGTATVERTLSIQGGRLELRATVGGVGPRMAGTLSLRTFLQASAGLRTFGECVRDGDLSWQGDVLFAVEFLSYFHLP